MGGFNQIISYISNSDFSGLVLYLVCLFFAACIAISFHEFAHAFVAFKLGDPTAKNLGRMTLDPFKHFDPIGLLCFMLFGLGYAKPVMVNPRNLKHYRRDDVLIAIAGPLTNLVLSFLFFGIYFFTGIFLQNEVLSTVLWSIVSLNLSLAVFNVLPIPPLDGFHVVSSLFIRRSYKVVDFLRRFGFVILIALLWTGVISRLMGAVSGFLIPLYLKFFSLFL